MSGTTSSVVLVGERNVGPFGTREWRAMSGVTLIEKHRPCWTTTGILDGRDHGRVVYLPAGWTAAEELVAVVAARCLGDPDYLELLARHGVPQLDVADELLDGPPLARELVDAAVALVSRAARLGIVRAEADSWLGDDDLTWLRGVDVDVDDFRLNPALGSP